MNSTRVAWGDFPPVIRNGLSMLSREPEYIAAKAGDPQAALELVYRLMTDEMVEEARALIGNDADARIVPIQAQESTGRNKIPLAIAEVLAFRLDLEVEYDICQTNRVFRTGSSSDHRLAFCPKFAGKVEPGRSYLIVDDTMTVGGTIAEMRGYIISNGGKVAGAAVMVGRENTKHLPITPKMLETLRQKHGEQLNTYWTKEFGHGLDKLTQHEAGHLRTAVSFDAIRDRISAARDAARRSVDEGATRPQNASTNRLSVVGYSEYRAGQIGRAESFFLKAQDAFWLIGDQLPEIRLSIEQRALAAGSDPQQALKTFRSNPEYADLAEATKQAVSSSGLAHAAEKRLLLTQRRLEREQKPQESDADMDTLRESDLDYR
ncbi:phosphoribosyltransferase [Pseudomonas amygdali]|uniref:phosphoribosyltransferase n=1 Tax=Pseudomonas amygdali TaxID=47877 RepID=UPI0006E65FD7|nr:phosphoribosyltransferase [Pseudomonas amygdali]KPY55717.1 hypothetical protein ALO93_200293 [Pseudomonas amygdali pv. sesami]